MDREITPEQRNALWLREHFASLEDRHLRAIANSAEEPDATLALSELEKRTVLQKLRDEASVMRHAIRQSLR
jgi:hypothetical protein